MTTLSTHPKGSRVKAIDPPVLRRPDTVAAMVLATDVTTKWGLYAHGTPVDIESSSELEHVIVLADLPRNRLLARVPRSVVRRAAEFPPRTRRRCGVVGVPCVAVAWAEGTAA